MNFGQGETANSIVRLNGCGNKLASSVHGYVCAPRDHSPPDCHRLNRARRGHRRHHLHQRGLLYRDSLHMDISSGFLSSITPKGRRAVVSSRPSTYNRRRPSVTDGPHRD